MKSLNIILTVFLSVIALTAGAQAQSIDWDTADRDRSRTNQSELGQPVNRPLSALDDVQLPVLLPLQAMGASARQDGEPGVLFFPRSETYTASCYIDDVQIEISGYASATRTLASVISIPEITLTETGQEARFSRYGAGYVVAVICSDPNADTRCTSPDFLRSILSSLRMAGGSPA